MAASMVQLANAVIWKGSAYEHTGPPVLRAAGEDGEKVDAKGACQLACSPKPKYCTHQNESFLLLILDVYLYSVLSPSVKMYANIILFILTQRKLKKKSLQV